MPRQRSSDSATFNKMKDYFDKQFDEMRDEFKAPEKKRKADVEFKKKSCEIQFKFNEEQLQLVQKALKHLKKGSKSKAKSKLEEVEKNINKRNKLIKIADKSPGGWDTVKEYETDSVASDSEDEKRLKRAEKRALEKIKEGKSNNGSKRFKSSSSSTLSRNPESSSGRAYVHTYSRAKPTDRCITCGGYGHWRYECPEKRRRKDGDRKQY